MIELSALKILLLPLASALLVQLVKPFIGSNNRKFEFNLKAIFAYSGMPSGHSALTISLAAITGLELGIADPVFAITVVLAILVIRDALGLRQYLGQHGKVINILVKDLKDDQVLDEYYPQLLEKVGHTPMQVLVGSLIGLTVSLLGYYLL